MIILDTKLYAQSSRVILENFKALVKIKYNALKKKKNQDILMILTVFSDEDIIKAIDSMRLDDRKNIIVDNQTRQSIILRYLEFGGESVKALHLLSSTRKEVGGNH